MSPSCLHRLNLCEVASSREMTRSVDFTSLVELSKTEERPRAGKADLRAADNLRRLAFADRPLRPKLFKMFVKPFGPKGDPAASAFHETDLQFGVAIEYALADHVHESNHTFEGEGGHMDIAVFLHALAAGTHDAPNAILAVVLGLRVHGKRHADLLRGGVDRIEHAVAEIDAVNVGRQHRADDTALLGQVFQFSYCSGRLLHGNESHALQPFWVGHDVFSPSQPFTGWQFAAASGLSAIPLTIRAMAVPKMTATSIPSSSMSGKRLVASVMPGRLLSIWSANTAPRSAPPPQRRRPAKRPSIIR